jgi:hypothetical protein
MAMSKEDREEMEGIFAAGMAKGIALFRSAAEEEAAKTKANEDSDSDKGKETKADDTGDGFDLPGFLLGRK